MPVNPTVLFFPILLSLVMLIILGYVCFFVVHQQTAVIIERFGKFLRVASPGLNIKIPFIDQIIGTMNLRLDQLDVEIETKTKDDVFIHIVVSVQYKVLPQKIEAAFYTLYDAQNQIQAFVFDVVRAKVPNIKLDDVFAKKDEIADAVKEELSEVMNDFGYDILKALVTDINPDAKVKAAMNEINESQRLRLAAMERGEAEKIIKVKQAEAEAESKILQGQGVAGQRKAIIEGLRDSLGQLQRQMPDASTKDAMVLLLVAQYFDTLKDMSSHSKSNTILVPHAPSSLTDLYDQIRNMIAINQLHN